VLLEGIRHVFALLTRAAPPDHEGLWALTRRVNTLLLRLGAGSVVEAKIKTGTVMLVDLSTQTQMGPYYSGTYDSLFMKAISVLFDRDAAFLDVGANIGFYSVAVAHMLKLSRAKGRVYSYEPLEGNYERLVENLARNGLRDLSYTFRVGLSNYGRTELLVLREDFSHGSSTGNASMAISEAFDAGFAKTPIEVVALDAIWDSDMRIDLIKVDIEGHEDLFLQGASETLCKHRPTILMEVNKPYFEARGIDFDRALRMFLPERYYAFRPSTTGGWAQIGSFRSCRRVDNVILVPEEKLTLPRYCLLNHPDIPTKAPLVVSENGKDQGRTDEC